LLLVTMLEEMRLTYPKHTQEVSFGLMVVIS